MSKFLALQAYAKPHYLALGLTEDEREDVNNAADEDLADLEKLDPLRRAHRLARKALRRTTSTSSPIELQI